MENVTPVSASLGALGATGDVLPKPARVVSPALPIAAAMLAGMAAHDSMVIR